MNLEQALAFSRELKSRRYSGQRVFVSANTHDFAAARTSPTVHPDSLPEFQDAELAYFPSLRSALNHLRTLGELP